MRSLLVVLLSTILAVRANDGLSNPVLERLTQQANNLLAASQFNNAVDVFSEAISLSPNDYVLYYKRGTALFGLGRLTPARDDFDRVLNMTKGEFEGARVMKARILAKHGDFDGALTFTSNSAQSLRAEIQKAKKSAEKGKKERDAQLWTACVESTSDALNIAGYSTDLRRRRVECEIGAGDLEAAAGDLVRLSQITQPPSATLQTLVFRLSFFYLAPSPSALNSLKQCLHLDPDSKPCLKLHRLSKTMDRSFNKLEDLVSKEDWRGAVKVLTSDQGGLLSKYEDAIATETHSLGQTLAETGFSIPAGALPNPKAIASTRYATLLRALCVSYTHLSLTGKAKAYCEQLVAIPGLEDDADGLMGRAEHLLKSEEFEDAVRAFEKVWEQRQGDRHVHSRLNKAKELLRKSKQKDYYKVLGVDRHADTKTIKKAFRKAAMKAHPDKGGSEAKMATVNEAYEVLSKPELRQRFDNGDDPNDPNGGNPFAGGGHPFGGGFPGGGGGHPFAQFFQQQGGGGHGGFEFRYSG